MQLVIDNSVLDKPELSSFLSGGANNRVVVTDYLAHEIFGAPSTARVRKSLQIVSQYPEQVIVLKSTGAIARLSPKRAKLHDRLINTEGTKNFPQYCAHIISHRPGSTADLLNKYSGAQTHMNALLTSAEIVRDEMLKEIKKYSPSELSSLRSRKRVSGSFQILVVEHIKHHTQALFRDLDPTGALPKYQDALYSLQFRFSVCFYMLQVHWAASGGLESAKPHTLRNDITDMTYVAYATMYDGIMSKDEKLLELYRASNVVLKNFFGVNQ